MERKQFSTREWIFILVILALIQGSVWYISFVNSGNPSALTYVSFAGTLTSIILAVLAIGYTYGESQSQKYQSENVATQIRILNDVIKNIQIESKSLENITKMEEQLRLFSEKFETRINSTHDDVKETKLSVESLIGQFNTLQVGPSNEDSSLNIDNSVIAQLLFQSNSTILIISL